MRLAALLAICGSALCATSNLQPFTSIQVRTMRDAVGCWSFEFSKVSSLQYSCARQSTSW